jgi:hypothetical protein
MHFSAAAICFRRLFRCLHLAAGHCWLKKNWIGTSMKLFLPVCFAVLLGLVQASPALSQSKDAQSNSEDVSKAINPSKASPRFFLRNEFREREDGAQINITEALYDLPLTDKLVLRTQIPYVINNQENGPTSYGLGNITNGLYYRYYSGEGTSYFAGLEARWNTLSKPTLGFSGTQVAPTWFAAINVPKYNTILFPFVQTYFTVQSDDGQQDATYTALKGRFLTKLENRYYIFGEPIIYIDHELSDVTTGVLELEFGRFVNSQTMVYVRPGAGLWGDLGSPFLYEWNFEVGYRYFFK